MQPLIFKDLRSALSVSSDCLTGKAQLRKSSIIGVTPPEFFGLEVGSSLDISIPLMMQQQTMPGIESYAGSDSGRPVITVMDRLRLGVTMPQAQAGLNVLYHSISNSSPNTPLRGQTESPILARREVGIGIRSRVSELMLR